MKILNLQNKLAIAGLKYVESKVKKAYEKSCHGDWNALKDIKFLDNVETFYIHWAVFEALAYNLKAYQEEETE